MYLWISRLFHSTTSICPHPPLSVLKLFSELFPLLSWNPFTPPLFTEWVRPRCKFPSQIHYFPLWDHYLSPSLLRPLLLPPSPFPLSGGNLSSYFIKNIKSIRWEWNHFSVFKSNYYSHMYLLHVLPSSRYTGWDYAMDGSSTVYLIHLHFLHTRLLLWHICYSLSPSSIHSSLLIPITI